MMLASVVDAAAQAASVSGVQYGLFVTSIDAAASSRAVAFGAAALVWMVVMLLCARLHRAMQARLRSRRHAVARR